MGMVGYLYLYTISRIVVTFKQLNNFSPALCKVYVNCCFWSITSDACELAESVHLRNGKLCVLAHLGWLKGEYNFLLFYPFFHYPHQQTHT